MTSSAATWDDDAGARDAALASRAVRLVAAGIDVLVMWAPVGLAVGGLFLFAGASLTVLLGVGAESILTQLTGSALGIASLAAIAVGTLATLLLTLYQWYLVAVSGQTIGKRIVGVRIVLTDGRPCGFFAGVFLRSIVFGLVAMLVAAIPYIGGLLVLFDFVPAFGPERRCVHDYLAGTKVVWASDKSARKWLSVLVLLGVLALAGTGFVLFVGIPATLAEAMEVLDPEPRPAPPPSDPTPTPQPPGATPAPPGDAPVDADVKLELKPAPPPADDAPPAPPPREPGATPPDEAAAGDDTSDDGERHIYMWTDDEGQTHIVDREDLVPARYRDRARRQ